MTDLSVLLPNVFATLKEAYEIKNHLFVDISTIDSISLEELSSHKEIAAISMRKLQMLNHISIDGVPTTSDIVIGVCIELVRALDQLVSTTPGLPAASRTALVEGIQGLESCAIVVGDVFPNGEIGILE